MSTGAVTGRTTRGPGGEVSRDIPTGLLGDLVAEAVRDALGPGRTRLVVLAMSKDENPKATVLAFPERATRPALVIKVATTPGASPAVLAEATALRAVAEADAGLMGGTVPSCVDVRVRSGRAVLVTTARPGVPLSTGYHRWRHTASPDRVRADFALAASWLEELGRVSCPGEHQGKGAPDWAARLRVRWPHDLLAARVALGLSQRIAKLGPGTAAPCGVVHGDFWCGNILQAAGRVTGIVDWEHAETHSDPLRDWARFALGYALYLDRHTRAGRVVAGHPGLVAGAWGEPVRHVFRGGNWFAEIVEGFVGDGLAATGRSRRLWRDALVVGLAEVAVVSDHPVFARQHLGLAGEVLSW